MHCFNEEYTPEIKVGNWLCMLVALVIVSPILIPLGIYTKLTGK